MKSARSASFLRVALLLLGVPAVLGAQQGHAHGEHPPARPADTAAAKTGVAASAAGKPAATPAAPDKGGLGADAIAASANASMSGPIVVTPYMTLTPERTATAADSARAAQVADELRRAIAKYKDVNVAEADGYRIFAPGLRQEVYHFTSTWRSVKESFRFDPAQPSSLLYRRTPQGKFELVGAMYHAPKRLSLEKLDARVPLSMARWHAHTNFCVPKRRDRERWLERKDGKPVFGPLGGIATRERCDAVDGKFHEQVFGWMVHAMVFAGSDLATVWGGHHEGHR